MFFNYNRIKWKQQQKQKPTSETYIKNIRIPGKSPNIWKLNNTFLNKAWIQEKAYIEETEHILN